MHLLLIAMHLLLVAKLAVAGYPPLFVESGSLHMAYGLSTRMQAVKSHQRNHWDQYIPSRHTSQKAPLLRVKHLRDSARLPVAEPRPGMLPGPLLQLGRS